MSNHVATITKDEGRCSFSRKALSVFMAVLLAFLMMPMVPAESALAATDDAVFADSEPDYTVDAANDGSYSVEWNNGEPVNMAINSIVSNVDNQAFTGGQYFTDDAEVDYVVRYFTDDGDKKFDDGDTQLGDGMTAPGAVGGYWIVALTENARDAWRAARWGVEALAEQTGIIAQYFEVTARSFSDVEAVNVVYGEGNVYTDTFTYNATDQTGNIGFVDADGKLINPDYYSVSIYEKGSNTPVNEVKNAGDYEARLIGLDGYKNSETTVEFTVEPLDLSEAVIYTPDFKEDNTPVTDVTTINGVDITAYVEDGAISARQIAYVAVGGQRYAESATGQYLAWDGTPSNLGGYVYRVEAVDDSDNVVADSYQEYQFNVVNELATFTYDDVAFADLADEDPAPIFDLSTGEAAISGDRIIDGWDASLVESVGAFLPRNSSFTVVPETVDAAGAYTAIARMDVPTDFSYGGSQKFDFYAVSGILDSDSVDVVVSFYGLSWDIAKGTYVAPDYTGNAVTPSITVKNGDDVLTADTDYSVAITDQTGAAVESMVDAGTYAVTITLANGYIYESGNRVIAKFHVVIGQRELTSITVDSLATSNAVENELPYTGSAIEPTFTGHYANTNVSGTVDVALDPSWYTISGIQYADQSADVWTTVDEILEPGTYRINLEKTEACINYKWDDNYSIELNIVETAYFADVASDAWYAEEIAQAVELGYVRGMGDNLFFPNADMTRAQFAQVLYNMAGEPSGWWEDTASNESGTYPTQFSDVEADAWYAKAVSWASEAGIVNGTSDTTFDPEGKISREQIATMLYRYAGNGATADQAVLDAFVDGDEVSDWAVTAMAWAVENGYMNGRGNDDLQPQGTATRAEVAALAVRVQPEAYEA